MDGMQERLQERTEAISRAVREGSAAIRDIEAICLGFIDRCDRFEDDLRGRERASVSQRSDILEESYLLAKRALEEGGGVGPHRPLSFEERVLLARAVVEEEAPKEARLEQYVKLALKAFKP